MAGAMRSGSLQGASPGEAGVRPVEEPDGRLVRTPAQEDLLAVAPRREVQEAGLGIPEDHALSGDALDLVAHDGQGVEVGAREGSAAVGSGRGPDPYAPLEHGLA